MRTVLAAAAFAALAAGVAAQDKGKAADKYESKEGKYAVAFPAKPTTTTSKVGETTMNVATVEKAGSGFVVIYSDLPAGATKLAKAKDILEGGEKGLVANLKAKVTSSKEKEFGKQKYPSREIVADAEMVTVRVTLVLAGDRLYQVFVHGPKEFASGKEADKFLESFEIK
jgi:hypothetical protein